MQQNFLKVDNRIQNLVEKAEKKCNNIFSQIEKIEHYNTQKILWAFRQNNVSETHFTGTTGYGYDDRGRDTLEKVFADIMGAEDSIIRHNFVSGTHAITTALFGVLRPKDRIVSLTGIPYDTLQEAIGIRGEGNGSLRDFGIIYEQLDLLENGEVNFDEIPEAVKGVKVAYIQRSRGYTLRPSLTIDIIAKMVEIIRQANPNAIIMVDNCYGEFVEYKEPTQVGVDIIIGSLIKNPGGGIAKTGGYIAGRKDLVEQCAYRLTAPGVGKEVGCSLGETRNMFMGLFFAPSVVASALKTAVLTSALFADLGYPVTPKYDECRADIIQAVTLNNEQGLVAFCQGIQKGSPIDAFVSPEPWDMPGYEDKVVMAAGAFTMGASIELSADGPVRKPYAAWLQGGLTYPSGKIGVTLAAQSMFEKGLIKNIDNLNNI